MRHHIARWIRCAGLASVLALAAVLPAAAAPVPAGPRVAAPISAIRPDVLDVSESEIAASNEKVRMAYGALVAMWSTELRRAGVRFEAPALLRYRGTVRTACGVMSANNAAYCFARNAVYFDDVFLARLARAASRSLGTDGDMAALGVIAHEMGHAVAMQLGEDSDIPYRNEAAADCLAGAFARQSQRDGSLEPGDIEEAFFGMASAGDPTPELTGDRRVDSRILHTAALMGHGTRDQRMGNFSAGLRGGPAACLAGLRDG